MTAVTLSDNDMSVRLPAPATIEMALAAMDVMRERLRQITDKGHTITDDDLCTQGELGSCAIAFIQAANAHEFGLSEDDLQVFWPWEDPPFEPDEDRIRNLVKAAALILAELERLARANAKGRE